ncbi:DUF1847 domain-containing protein [Chloroflexota bacterium]
MKSMAAQCAKCPVVRCRTFEKDKKLPDFCPTKNCPDIIKESVERNKNDPEVRAINQAWVELMNKVGQNRWSWTRLEEVIEYAKIRGVKKIGIASCVGLLSEAKLLTNVLERHDFDVVSVSCLAGEVAPEDVDIVREGIFCNPIMQAGVLNREGTELNIMLGLCVGHDILFLRHSKADVTPLIVKDRALGHNPAVALYLSDSYYQNRFLK